MGFADNKLNLAKVIISACDRIENILGKGENAGYQHFLLYLQCFKRVVKGRDSVVKS